MAQQQAGAGRLGKSMHTQDRKGLQCHASSIQERPQAYVVGQQKKVYSVTIMN